MFSSLVPQLIPLHSYFLKTKMSRNLQLTEFCDSDADISSKLAKLLSMVKASKNTVIFTGAGISTAASIPER